MRLRCCDNAAAVELMLVVPEGGPLDAGCKKRRLALIVCDRGRLTLGAEQVERNPLFANERHELVRRIRPHPVGEFASSGFEFPSA